MKYKRGFYDILLKTCAKSPSNVAVRFLDDGEYKFYTYSELFGVCEYISQNLQLLNCNKSVVGLVTRINPLILSAVAAVHKCNTTFMFVDPSQDLSTFKEINFRIIIAIGEPESPHTSQLMGRTPDVSFTIFNIAISFYIFNNVPSQDCMTIKQHSFISMTSGSTGEPKHIQVPMQCILPNISDLTKLFNVVPEDVIYFSTPLTFDPSMVEMLLACTNRASLLIAPEKAEILFPANPKNSVTFWQTTPSKFFQQTNTDISNYILRSDSTLKVLALGGEPLNGIKYLKSLKSPNNNTKIFTLYGVTEMSCWACCAELDLTRIDSDTQIPLGACLSQTEVHVRPTHENENIGNIILMSKNRKCVVLNKSDSKDAEASLKWIDTGDLGEIKNGTIYYRGRRDDIIKRFGHKINLQIIESTVMQCPRVKACSCIWLPKPRLLVVYYVSETFKSEELSYFLKCKLDDRHWPDKIIRVDSIPTNTHGKASKHSLTQLYQELNPSEEYLKLMFLSELRSLISDELTYDDVKDKDFYSVGGTSFMAVTMCNKLSHICPSFGKIILPYLMSQHSTIDEVLQIAHKKINNAKNKPKRQCKDKSPDNVTEVSRKRVRSPKTSTIEFTLLWSYDTGKCVDATPTLFLDGHNLHVLVGSHSGKLVSMNAITGAENGILDLKSRIEAPVYCFQHQSMIPYAIVGSYNGTIVCFTIEECLVQWKINIGCMIKSKAVVCDENVYVASYDGCVRCIDVLTGDVKHVVKVCDQPISANLVLAKNQYILLGTLSGAAACIHAGTNSIIWRGNYTSPIFASPVLYNNDKYVVFAEVNGEINCRTVEKGIKLWRYQGAQGNVFSSVQVRELGKSRWQMTFGCHDNKVYSVVVKNYQPAVMWTSEMPAPVYATPCEINTSYTIVAASNGHMFVLDSDTGVTLADYRFPHETFSSPAVYGDYIYIGCRNDYLYALRFISS